MAGSNTIALLAGGLVVVALSFGAGMLGGSIGRTSTDAVDAPAPRSVPDSVVRGRLDELDRRLSNVEERLRVAEDTADAAMTRTHEIDALRRAIEALRAGGTAAPLAPAPPRGAETPTASGDDIPQPLTDEERAAREAEQREKFKKRAREIVAEYAPGLMKQRLSRIADATAQGAADRRSQIYAESKALATQYQLTPQEEERVREILGEEAETSVRDVAPYLGGGLERANYGAVKEKLRAIWDRRDEQMADVLDEKQLEEYQETQQEWRKVHEKVLDDMDAERRSR